MKSERVGWILAVVLCVLLPLGYYDLTVVGGGALTVLAWRVRREQG